MWRPPGRLADYSRAALAARSKAAGTPEAEETVDYFVPCIRRQLGALAAVVGGVDALVFCGGIGESSRTIRARVCEGMDWIGIELDRGRNAQNAGVICTELGRTSVLVIPTDEEIVIARAARHLAAAAPAE